MAPQVHKADTLRMDEKKKRTGGIVEAECPRCGTVQVPAHEFVVYVREDSWSASYQFRCPACRCAVEKASSEHATELLVAWGAQVDVWRPPAEVLEPKDGPPFTLDDVLDLHLLLEKPDWFEQLTAAKR